MDKSTVVLAALAPANGATHSPVQVQKLLFLIERNIPSAINGPVFDFKPYDYGPFDSAVYQTLDLLNLNGLVETVEEPGRRWKHYRLTPEGQAKGNEAISQLEDKHRQYIHAVSKYVRSLSFTQLVSAIYREYPEMKANSVFRK